MAKESETEKVKMEVFASSIDELANSLPNEDEFSAAFSQVQQLASNIVAEDFLNALHVPADSGKYESELRDMLAHIPDGWGRWIGTGSGWYPLITELHENLLELFPDYELHQVKEKYGTLRFYWGTGRHPYVVANPRPEYSGEFSNEENSKWNKLMDKWQENYDLWEETPAGEAFTKERARRFELAEKLVDQAENKSAFICEVCGQPGQLTDNGWLTTVCLEHAEGRPYVRHYITVKGNRNKLTTKEDAEELIELIKLTDKNDQYINVSLYEKDNRTRCDVSEEFISTLLDYIATRHSDIAERWGANPKSNLDISYLTDESQKILSEQLAEYSIYGPDIDYF